MIRITPDESGSPQISVSDLTIKISSEGSTPPDPQLFFKVAVICSKGTGAVLNGDLLTKNDVNDIKVKASEIPLVSSFEGAVRFYTIEDTITQPNLNILLGEIYKKAWNLVVITDKNLDFGSYKGHLGYTCVDTEAVIYNGKSFEELAKLDNTSVWYDSTKEGKAVWVLTAWIPQGGYILKNTAKLSVPNNFNGVVEEEESLALDDLSISHIFKANNKIFVRGWWIGGFQAITWFEDRIVEYETKEACVPFIGEKYNSFTLKTLQGAIQGAILKIVGNVIESLKDVNIIPFDQQTTTNKTKGFVDGVSITYSTQSEIRTIFINLKGVL